MFFGDKDFFAVKFSEKTQRERFARLKRVGTTPSQDNHFGFMKSDLDRAVIGPADFFRQAAEVVRLNPRELINDNKARDTAEFREVLLKNHFFHKLHGFVRNFLIRVTRVLHEHAGSFSGRCVF